MLDYFKAATIAAFVVGAGATSGALGSEATVASPLAPLAINVVAIDPVPSETVVTPLPDAGLAPEPAESAARHTDLPATSLAALVRLHASSIPSDAEHECLAGAVYFESKGEPLEGQLAVANVILNRAASGRFPASACGVVHQHGQFSFVRGGGFPAIPRGSLAWRQAVAVAHIARAQLWDAPARNALYFHARRVAPGWRLARVAAVGNHVFYR